LVSIEERYRSTNRRHGVNPEIESKIYQRMLCALKLKEEIESLLGHPLEKDIS
jgi:hypothetical protein